MDISLQDMACITCTINNRICDGTRPVCQACRNNAEYSCRWPTRLGELPEVYILEELELPIPIQNVEANDVEEYYDLHPPELRFLINDRRMRHFLHFDPEFREILAHINAGDDFGQGEVAAAIIKANMEVGPSTYCCEPVRRYNGAIPRIREKLEIEYSYKLGDQDPPDPSSWINVAISICLANIYESYDINDHNHFLHLTFLHDLAHRYMFRQLQPINVPNTIVKSLIYHVAIGSTFNYSTTVVDRPYTYVTSLCERSSPAMDRNDLNPASFMGIPLQILDIVYQISHTRHEALSRPGVAHETSTRQRLRNIKRKLETGEGLRVAWPHANERPKETERHRRVLRLYRFACLILLSKTMERTTTRKQVRSLFDRAWTLVRPLAEDNDLVQEQSKTIIWPLLILYFAGQAHERQAIWRILQELQASFNIAKLTSTLNFLSSVEHAQQSATYDLVFEILGGGDQQAIMLF